MTKSSPDWGHETGRRDPGESPVTKSGPHGLSSCTRECDIRRTMQERTKKLKCLCRISRLIESHHNREGAILQGIVNLLPPSWQYPEICCAKLTLDDTEYRSRGYQRSPWFQSAPVRIAGRVAGLLEVFYLEKIETQEVGPFLQEEQELLDAVAERVGSVLERIAVERQLKADQAALKERLKELGCLYGISQLAERYSGSLNDLLQGIVELLPPSWQYPEICQARLVLYDQSYQTVGLRETYWVQEAPVRVRGEKAGQIEVFYLEPRPILDEGPFLREERDLIDAIAERVGKMVEQFQAEQQMQIDRSALQETNAALKGVPCADRGREEGHPRRDSRERGENSHADAARAGVGDSGSAAQVRNPSAKPTGGTGFALCQQDFPVVQQFDAGRNRDLRHDSQWHDDQADRQSPSCGAGNHLEATGTDSAQARVVRQEREPHDPSSHPGIRERAAAGPP